jgi:hypothetical protein
MTTGIHNHNIHLQHYLIQFAFVINLFSMYENKSTNKQRDINKNKHMHFEGRA